MLFNSPVFLWVFFPLFLALYFVLGRKNGLLLAASLLFYAWGEHGYVLLLVFSIAVNYSGGLLIGRGLGRQGRKMWFIAAIFLNLFILASFKYAAFFTAGLNRVLAIPGAAPLELPLWHLPLGISFFTFQGLSYLTDVYRGKEQAQGNFLTFALYMSMFPQLISGPIVRYGQISGALARRRADMNGFAMGMERFIHGLGKKLILADTLAVPAGKIFSLPTEFLTMPLAWFGALCFTLQLYFDFAGYSDMAIGVGKMLGFTIPENFNFPYMAGSIVEFWKRWHMTLSAWLRDYIFLPAAYALQRRIPEDRAFGIKTDYFVYGAAMMTAMFVCGLWHGAAWTFVAWGLLHGLFAVGEKVWWGKKLKRLWAPIRHGYTLLVVITGWVLFRSADLSGAAAYLSAMFSFSGWGTVSRDFLFNVSNYEIFIVVAGGAFSIPLAPLGRKIAATVLGRQTLSGDRRLRAAADISYGLFLFMVSAVSLAAVSARNYKAFIYFRF